MMFALLPAAPASAGTLTVIFQGTATLDAGISAGCVSNIHNGGFRGTASGTHGAGAATVTVTNATVTATFRYCNATAISGMAVGSITFSGGGGGSHTCDFTWVRTGVLVEMTFTNCSGHGGGGEATAVYAPTSAPGAIPGTAEFTGEGTIG